MSRDAEKSDFSAVDINDFRASLDDVVKNEVANHFWVVRFDGTVEKTRVRSEHSQEKPYKPLDKVLKTDQRESDISDAIVGIYCPPYSNGVNTYG